MRLGERHFSINHLVVRVDGKLVTSSGNTEGGGVEPDEEEEQGVGDKQGFLVIFLKLNHYRNNHFELGSHSKLH